MSLTGKDRAPGPASIRIGVAGWSYPDWRGTFYPRGLAPRFELPRVARLLDCAEINVTFYRYPEPRLARGWLEAVEDRPGFLFTSKVPKELTHERWIDPVALASGASRLKEGLAPLWEAGRLAALLLQFPFYFRDSPESRDRIRRLVDALRPVPCVVEVRHRSFFFGPEGDQASPPSLATGEGSAIRFLEEIGAGLCNIDMPPGRTTIPPTSINTSRLGYLRLHGRNAKSWFDPKAGRDQKYDYLYSLGELMEWRQGIERLAARTELTIVIANNHFRGQAPANALLLLHLFGRAPPEPPVELLRTFPEVARVLGGRGPSPDPARPPAGLPPNDRERALRGGAP
jgi:uncharacterized protein YecE (DUF72 family)